MKNYRILENKVERLSGLVNILQNAPCTVTAPLQEKLAALESLYDQYNVHMICEALDVSQGTFYNHIFRNKKENKSYVKRREEFCVQIQKVYDDSRQVFERFTFDFSLF